MLTMVMISAISASMPTEKKREPQSMAHVEGSGDDFSIGVALGSGSVRQTESMPAELLKSMHSTDPLLHFQTSIPEAVP